MQTLQVCITRSGYNIRVPGSLTTYAIASTTTLIRGAANNSVKRLAWGHTKRPELAEFNGKVC